jgi:CRP/FNR family transcriptional regulator, anaerobic regulatory protein
MKQLVEDRTAPWSSPCTALHCVSSPSSAVSDLHPIRDEPEGQRLRFAPHSLVFLEGDRADRMFQVVGGVVMLYKLLADGRRQVVELLGSGDVFGLTHQSVYNCSAETLGPVIITAYHRSVFDRSPALVRALNRCLQAQMWALHDHAMLLGRKTALERVASFLLRCVPNRSGPDCSGPRSVDDHADIHLTMTRQEIADYLGLTIETVSRAFSELRRRGVLATDRPEEVRINSVCRVCRLTGGH